MNSSPLNNDLSGVSINIPLTLPSVFVSILFLRALNKSSLIKFTLISYVSLKVVSATFLLVCFVCLKESACETRKSGFYFTSKALFVLEIIKF